MPASLSPNRLCDLVLKGGITSGVLYPPAIDEIARRFTLCGIGGTSAGAIAAALAAAAELRRRNGSNAGYEELHTIPQTIGAEGKLLELFRPDSRTSPLFSSFLRALRLKNNTGLFDKARLYLDVARLLISDAALAPMAANGHGLCSGMANGASLPARSLPPLTTWLSERIDSIAGLPRGRALTFGDLWDAPRPEPLAATMTGARSIQLQLVATCLSFGRPYALPHLDNRFAFAPDEMLKLLPGYVVDQMIHAGNQIERPAAMPPHLVPLPNGAQMPVILAVRMSLSFPFLFSLIPLHYPDYRAGPGAYERIMFADGGITSNLPIHFFDSPFPRWPTLAINLQYAKEPGEYGRSKVGARGVWMNQSNSDGTLELIRRFLDAKTPLGQLLGLGGSVFHAAQTWTDNSFLTLPGYRDRVAEVWLDPNEGGMNLDMPPSVIRTLVEKGGEAGRRLVARFADAPPSDPLSWDGHRWTRFRSTMAALARHGRAWKTSIDHPMPGDRSLWEILANAAELPSYRFSIPEQLRAATDATHAFEKFVAELDVGEPCEPPADPLSRPFCGEPRPRVSLQSRASMT